MVIEKDRDFHTRYQTKVSLKNGVVMQQHVMKPEPVVTKKRKSVPAAPFNPSVSQLESSKYLAFSSRKNSVGDQLEPYKNTSRKHS